LSRLVITREDVLALARGARLAAPPGAIVTERALETAREAGVEIIIEGGAPPPGGGSPGGGGSPLPAPAAEPAPPTAPEQETPQPATESTCRLIVTAFGRNRPRIMAELTGAIEERHGDIQEISQRVQEGWFHLVMLVDVPAGSSVVQEFRRALECLSSEDDYRVMVQHERVFERMHRI